MRRLEPLTLARSATLLGMILFAAILIGAVGCGKSNKPVAEEKPKDPANVEVKPEVVIEKPDPYAIWTETIAKANAHLEQDELDQTEEVVEELNKLAGELDGLEPNTEEPGVEPGVTVPQVTRDHRAELAALEKQLGEKLAVKADVYRQEQLAAAELLMNRAKLVEATQAINVVLARLPTDEQRARAGVLATEIERRRKARRDLQSWMQLLESDDRREIATAQTQLSRDVDTTVSLLVEATEQLDKPILVRNAMELLRILNRPQASVPAMLAVLERNEQQENWPDVVEQLGKFTVPGAGQSLLDLTLAAKEPEQRRAVLLALAEVVDPPKQTLAALLPIVQEDGVELTAALRAIHRAVIVHQQFDLVSRRGTDFELTAEQDAMLDELPERLAKVMAGESKEAAAVATLLSASMRLVEPKVFEGVKVARAHSEAEDGPAVAVLDGVWNSIEPNTMWRHPVDNQSLIELDLGESRVVTGVKIWNLNEPGFGSRGWKEVHIYVGDSPAKMRLAAKGIVPQAPGAAETPDYSTIIPIEFVQGRYVRLVGKDTWAPNAHTGVTEIQVLGF
ncbi:MAG: hypothetical protein ACI9HK_001315 [Pirellulaceae bacterium]|jgi:hypothetical protein